MRQDGRAGCMQIPKCVIPGPHGRSIIWRSMSVAPDAGSAGGQHANARTPCAEQPHALIAWHHAVAQHCSNVAQLRCVPGLACDSTRCSNTVAWPSQNAGLGECAEARQLLRMPAKQCGMLTQGLQCSTCWNGRLRGDIQRQGTFLHMNGSRRAQASMWCTLQSASMACALQHVAGRHHEQDRCPRVSRPSQIDPCTAVTMAGAHHKKSSSTQKTPDLTRKS